MLEVGTSNGYSTIWLADAARAVGAELTSVELDADRLRQAQANLEDAGLATGVELLNTDAGAVLRAGRSGIYDLVFLDAERSEYTGYWPELARVLAPGGLLAVDTSSRTPMRSPTSARSSQPTRTSRSRWCRPAPACCWSSRSAERALRRLRRRRSPASVARSARRRGG